MATKGLPGLQHVDHVGLTVPELDAAVKFYTEVIGAVVSEVDELTALMTELVELATDPTGVDEAVQDVDLADLTQLLSSFGSCTGDVGFTAAADLDASGCVELGDLTVLLSNFGA